MKDITKLDFIGKVRFDWLDHWIEYKEIRKILLKVFPKEDWIQDFRYRLGIGGWEIETIYTQITMLDIDRLNKVFEDSIFRVFSIGLNYDLINVKKIRPNVCITIDYKIV
jgi:hypothetical protein